MQAEDQLTRTEQFKQFLLNNIRRSVPDITSKRSVDTNQFFRYHYTIYTTCVANTWRPFDTNRTVLSGGMQRTVIPL